MLTIGTFSKISSVTTKTLRFYDEIDLLKPIYVNKENGYRYYAVWQLKTILLINKLKMYNFTLEEISEVLTKPEDNDLLIEIAKKKKFEIEENIKKNNFVLKKLENDIVNLERGINIMSYLDNIEVKLVETEEKNILFVRDKINIKDYSKLMGKLFAKLGEEKLTPVGAPMSIYYEEEFNPESCDIEVAIPVNEARNSTRKLPKNLCATATLKGPYTELSSIYSKIKEWIDKEGYEVFYAPYEIYMTDPFKTAPEDNITEVYLPVKKI